MNKLSHSSLAKYLKCPESHRLHYKERLRPTVSSAALLFGSALDDAINVLLKKEDKDPMQVFASKWEKGFINNKLVSLPSSTQIVYAASDFDKDLMKDIDWQKLLMFAEHELGLKIEDPVAYYNQCELSKKSKAYKQFPEEENKFLNYANWLSLYRKAEIILEAYKTEIVPKIVRVIDVQKKIELKSENDVIEGYIDFIAEWEDGTTRVFDNKSSSRLYDEDAVENSPQLALYALHEGLNKAGFIVYLKSIQKNKVKTCGVCGHDGSESRAKTCNNEIKGKRCGGEWTETITPKAKIQVVLGDVNPKLEEAVLDNFNSVNKLIKENVYYKNTHACDDYYGGSCPYKALCFKGVDKDLEKV